MSSITDKAKLFGRVLRAELRNAESVLEAMRSVPGTVEHRKAYWETEACMLRAAEAAFTEVERHLTRCTADTLSNLHS